MFAACGGCYFVVVLAAGETNLHLQGQPQNLRAADPARSRAEETLEWWNHIGDKLIAMAKDFPEARKLEGITSLTSIASRIKR